jgi:hypothetical protein
MWRTTSIFPPPLSFVFGSSTAGGCIGGFFVTVLAKQELTMSPSIFFACSTENSGQLNERLGGAQSIYRSTHLGDVSLLNLEVVQNVGYNLTSYEFSSAGRQYTLRFTRYANKPRP